MLPLRLCLPHSPLLFCWWGVERAEVQGKLPVESAWGADVSVGAFTPEGLPFALRGLPFAPEGLPFTPEGLPFTP